MHALRHVGFVEQFQDQDGVFPVGPEIRARMLVDLSFPLISGCYLPFHDKNCYGQNLQDMTSNERHPHNRLVT